MPLPVPGVDRSLDGIRLAGPMVQWACSLLLVLVFALLLPLTSQRRVVVTWIVAWAAQVVLSTPDGLFSLLTMVHPHGTFPLWVSILLWMYYPARFVLLTSMVIGSLQISGSAISTRFRELAWLAALSVGVIALELNSHVVAIFNLLATIIALFGCVEILLWRADGVRRRGLIFLASALALFAVLSTVYLLGSVVPVAVTGLAGLIHSTWILSGYGNAIALGILASAVIVMIVQEAFLDTARAHESRLSAVAESEARLTAIIQSAQEAIVTIGPGAVIELLNRAAAVLFNCERDDCLGRPLGDFLLEAPAMNQLVPNAPTNASTSPPPLQTGEVRRADGSVIPVEFTLGSIHGKPENGVVVVLRDLTARNAEAAEREEFERRMAESAKMLAIGRVVSGVAHELNNPLAVVLGQSEQLVDAAPAGDMRSGLTLIHEQAHRARHIVRQLLAFVRQREDNQEPVNPARAIHRAIASQQTAAAAHHITLVVDVPHVLPTVAVDATAVEQVVISLIDNAIEAVGEGGTVHVATIMSSDKLSIAVEDSGPGIDDALLPRMFEPFFTTKEPGRGTGLGLAVARGVAEQRGGTLVLENRPAPGIGARFRFTIPVVVTRAAEAIPWRSKVFPTPPFDADGNPGEVMLIDDESSVRTTLAKMFRRAGWRIREAERGELALEWLDAVPHGVAPAVILCDVKMPGLSGREVYERCLATRPRLAERFIFVTGDVLASLPDLSIAGLGREVVEKPFTIAEIARAVQSTVNHTSLN